MGIDPRQAGSPLPSFRGKAGDGDIPSRPSAPTNKKAATEQSASRHKGVSTKEEKHKRSAKPGAAQNLKANYSPLP